VSYTFRYKRASQNHTTTAIIQASEGRVIDEAFQNKRKNVQGQGEMENA
jgi:hypothetical protein